MADFNNDTFPDIFTCNSGTDLGKEVTRKFEVKDGTNVFRHNFEE